jgi:hypothetical protein
MSICLVKGTVEGRRLCKKLGTGTRCYIFHAAHCSLFTVAVTARVGFVKIKADCTLVDGKTHHKHPLPGICLLRGGAVAIFVALVCEDDGKIYSLLVEQPR